MELKFTLHSQQKRIFAICLLISFLFIVLFVRLFLVQIINGAWLQKKATSQWTRDLPLTAERGKILDSAGAALAVSYSTYNVYSRARQIENANEVASFLSKELNLSFDKVLSQLLNKGISEVLIKMQVEGEVAQKIIDKGYKGIFLSENTKRYYPYGDLLTQIIGFTSIDNVGQAGIELYYNDYLKGVDGESLVQSDLQGKEIENTLKYYIPSIAGANIALTINSLVQLAVEQTLSKIMEEQKPLSATCVIMKAKTGEIVSLSTKPSFDLNEVPRDNLTLLMESVKNKAVTDVYEPGSTFKILTMSSALDCGVTSLSDTFYCPGYRIYDGQKIKCWKTIGHGNQDLTKGIVNSCNCVFMDLAARLGKDRFYEYMKNFGLGVKTGVDISGESAGIVMNKNSAKNVDLVRMGFGQAIAVTPLQLITAVCSAVNGGTLMKPYLIKSIVSSDGKTISSTSPTAIRRVVSQKTSQTLNNMLYQVVNKVADNSFVEGYAVGGKTGTAQKYENGHIAQGKYISSFVGTYPADNPEYVMLLLVDEPSAGAYYGSVVAAPYAKEIFSKMFSALDILPVNYTPLKTVIVPSLIGETLSTAIIKLKSLNLEVEIDGEGGIVLSQIAPSGTEVKEGETIIIYT